MQDIRFALRQLLKAPGFAFIAILTLALGIGANTAMFTVIHSVLIRSMPYPNANALVSIGRAGRDSEFSAISWPTIQDLRKHSQTLKSIAGYVTDVAILQNKEGKGKTLLGTKVTCNLLDVLKIQPSIGRGFSYRDCREGASPTVLLSDRLWRRDFGADRGLIGKTIRIGDVPTVVIGVMPAAFGFPEEAGAGTASKGIWLPSRLTPELRTRGFTLYEIIGRLRPHVTAGQARAELGTIARDIQRDDPKEATGLSFRLRPYRETITGSLRPVFYGLAGALALVLLIACANVANLQLNRCLARRQEFALRAALGAPKWRIMAELIWESGLLSLAGTLAGLQVAFAILALLRFLPEDLIPRANEIEMRWGVLALLAVLASLATILSSLIPALFALRAEPQDVLRGGGRGISGRLERTRLAGFVVASEVALAAVLLVGCSLLFHTLYNLNRKALGFRIADVVTFTATPPTSAGYLAGPSKHDSERNMTGQVYTPLLNELRLIPGARGAALASSIPFDGVDLGSSFSLNGLDRKTPEERQTQNAILRVMSGGYGQALGTPLLKGRFIADSDTEQSAFVAVVNQAFARQFLRGRDALRQTLDLGGKDTGMERPYTVVGVVTDAAQKNLVDRALPEVDLSYRQIPEHSLFYPILLESAIKFVLRAQPDQKLSGAIRMIVQKTAPGFAIDDLQTMQTTVDKVDFSQRLTFYLMGAFAGFAILMVMVGVYGVLAQWVSQRQQEIGVRMALGATSSSIFVLILRRGIVLIAFGALTGLVMAAGLATTIRSFLYGITAADPWSYSAAATILLTVGLSGALMPARRASRLEPLKALHTE